MHDGDDDVQSGFVLLIPQNPKPKTQNPLVSCVNEAEIEGRIYNKYLFYMGKNRKHQKERKRERKAQEKIDEQLEHTDSPVQATLPVT